MKCSLLIVLLAIFGKLFLLPNYTFAIEDPLALPNNKMGVHILFVTEVESAAALVNSNGGDWGYVTIPIQAGDRDLEKWQKFMNDAKKFHVIPIIRLATEGDYFNTSIWRKPANEDILDFANFLNSLVWPVKNRYIVVFNEVNRSEEWGGDLNPDEYANLLKYAVSAFKSLNDDFFIISSGLDNAAQNDKDTYMNEYDYIMRMNNAVPGIFTLIDGLGSHSYPNPGFKQLPHILTAQSIYSFNFEKKLADKLSDKDLPIFITETGWSKEALTENKIAEYFKYAFKYVWSDENIVAVTPFLLHAGSEPFSQFSIMDGDGTKNEILLALESILKIQGKPTVNNDLEISPSHFAENLPLKSFPKESQYANAPLEKTDVIEDFFKWLLKL